MEVMHGEAQPLTVSEFIEHMNTVLSDEVAYVEGEISRLNDKGNLIFFTLVDKKSSVDCFALAFRIRVPIEEGMRVRIFGRPGLYVRSGRFRIDVYDVKPAGEGALRRAFELLKAKLEAEGLFDPERKRALPKFPRRIGLITSKDAAAYSDFLKILRERWGGIEISFINVPVQGREATRAILSAFDWFNGHAGEHDVLILTRGGGSLEDLAAFNSEEVARAVFRSKIPVVSAVGHERDVSLADFVADMRASTPSNAAELIVPHRREILWQVEGTTEDIAHAFSLRLADAEQEIGFSVAAISQAIHLALFQFTKAMRIISSHVSLFYNSVRVHAGSVREYARRISAKVENELGRQAAEMLSRERLLSAVSPQATLERGYSITFAAGTRRIIRDARYVSPGDRLDIRLARGRVESEVTGKEGY